ncbi:MAG: tRNA pseudouridine(38-40) synthase TruA, partial [Pedobacter sp.]
TSFHGWQIQPNAATVQQQVDAALSVVFRQKVETLGCGRTDAGVHATQFFAHFDLSNVPAETVNISLSNINALLPYTIAAKRIINVKADAHARFDATERSYAYFIHFKKDPFKINRSWLFKEKLDVSAMNKAAELLKGYTDFSAFSKSNTQTFTNNCRITNACCIQDEEGIVFTISADRFLRNMVRAIVGTLVLIGKNEIAPEGMSTIVESMDRSNAGQSVPACGLFLVNVKYPYITDK